MQSYRRITRSMSADISTNNTPSTQSEIEKIDNEIQTINNSIQSLKERLKQSNKVKYELEPTITVTDEYSGRTFILQKNPYELSLKYPKVNPETGQRLYGKREHWFKYYGKYTMATSLKSDFPDVEYIKDHFDHRVYHYSVGLSRPGYYWRDVSSDYDYGPRYVESHLPDANANANAKKNGKKK